VSLHGETIKTVKVGTTANETVGDASAVIGVVALNSDQAAFAIIQRKNKSLILVGLPKPGAFERGQSTFRAVVKGLERGAGEAAAPSPSPASNATNAAVAPFEPLWVSSVTASSTLPHKRNAYAPTLVVDPKQTYIKAMGDYRIDSAWCEGKPDEGIGESITITFERPTKIQTMRVKPGVWMTQKLFDANNIITGLEVATDDGRKQTVTVPPKRAEVEVKLGGAPITSLVVKVTSVKKGKMNDSCLSEITFDDHVVGVGFEKAATSSYAAALADIHKALWNGCDNKLFAKYFLFPFTYVERENTHSSDEKWRFKDHKRTLKTEAALVAHCKNSGMGGGPTEPTNDTLDTVRNGEVSLQVELAEVTQMIHMAWRDGAWRVTKID